METTETQGGTSSTLKTSQQEGGEGSSSSEDNNNIHPPSKKAKTTGSGGGDAFVNMDAAYVAAEEARREAAKKKEDAEEGAGTMAVTSEVSLEAVEKTRKNLKHEFVAPEGYEAPEPKGEDYVRAREYPFTLDPFQQKATECIDVGESVLVAAHTSAGKTVVAEYAIALSLRNNARVIYTSPIKALSNQKFREFTEEFEDVGLMTGDVTINPSASCLVMTTEILRSMLFRGSEIMREVAWVVFDEIHYLRDATRGVVWEETLILLPDTVKYVFLSATIPNAREFASWISKLHKQACHVVYTDYRPTPLQFYLFPAGGTGLYLVVDEKGEFRERNFEKAIATLKSESSNDSYAGSARARGTKRTHRGSGPSDIFKLVSMINERGYDPVIVFSFSKRECETYASQMSKLDFNSPDEKELVEAVFVNAIDSLSEEDKSLPQITSILPLLQRGIGIHHSGLLPILKETIEILFQEGLIKALFATETFSIGLNMPAKTVVFTSLRKFDGVSMRFVRSGELTQMAGRAGRRGLDDRGIVILMLDEKVETDTTKEMIKGAPDELNSAFHVTYSTLLNMLRLEFADPEFILLSSFHQFQNEKSLPQMEAKLKALTAARSALTVDDEELHESYFNIQAQITKIRERVRSVMNLPRYVVPFLKPGRLVRVRADAENDFGWGVVVKASTRSDPKSPMESQHVVDVILACDGGDGSEPAFALAPRPPVPGGSSIPRIVPILIDLLDGVSTLRVRLPDKLTSADDIATSFAKVKEAQKRFESIPLLDPIENLGVKSDAFFKDLSKLEGLVGRLVAHPLLQGGEGDAGPSSSSSSGGKKGKKKGKKGKREEEGVEMSPAKLTQLALTADPGLPPSFEVFEQRKRLEAKIEELKVSIRESSHLALKEDMVRMQRVLRRLGFLTSDNVIELKGRVAVEINAGDELLLTEMIFDGVFSDLTPPETAAVLSTFVFQGKSKEEASINPKLTEVLNKMKVLARRIGQVKLDCKLELNLEEYVDSFQPHLVPAVLAWASGSSFADVCSLTDVFEGSIIRAIRRLDELLRQLASAAKSIGDVGLEEKFAQTSTAIRRDIVFAASLYL